MKMRRAYCPLCKRDTKQIEAKTHANSSPHLLLVVFSLGLWLIPMFFMGMSKSPWNCDECGSLLIGGQLQKPDSTLKSRDILIAIVVAAFLLIAAMAVTVLFRIGV